MLTDTHVRQAKPRDKAYRLFDSHGLYLQVQPNGSKLWRYKYRLAGRENVYAIGSYSDISLKQAREEHASARECVRNGQHPADERRRRGAALSSPAPAAGILFKDYAEDWIKKTAIKNGWSAKYASNMAAGLKNHIYPYIGRMTMPSIKSMDILQAIQKLEAKQKYVTASKILGQVSSIFCSAVMNSLCVFDPTAPISREIDLSTTTKHATAHSREKLGEILTRVSNYGGSPTICRAIQFLSYTFVRTVEMRRAEWIEFDLDNGTWVIPAHKMKERRIHIVPLAPKVVELLKIQQKEAGKSNFVFPGTRSKHGMLGETTIIDAFQYMGYAQGEVDGHDFRASASTMLYEAGYREEVVEIQLSHVEANKSKRPYNHAKYWEERKAMMQWYADQLDACVAKYRETQEHKAAQASEARP